MKWFLKSYLGFLLYSLLGYSFVIWYTSLNNDIQPEGWLDWSCVIGCYFASVILTSFVIIKLPILRNYYNFYGKKDDMIIYRNNAKHVSYEYLDEMAIVIVSLLASVPLGILTYYLGAYDAGRIGCACFVASGVLSFFHEPK